MAEQKDAGPEKKGFFARRAERKEARKAAAAPLPARIPTPPLKGPPARPAAPPARPAPPPESRVSLESLPEVEKRIDRMSATERRQKLLERYEQKYGERLEAPKVFISIEDERKAEAAAAADTMAGGKAIDEGRLAAVTGMAPPGPAAPPQKPPAPAKPGFFGPKPAAPAPAKPGAPAPPGTAAPALARPAAPAPPRPAAPVAAEPKAAGPAPALPEGMTMGKYLWPAVWPFWGAIVRRWAKYRYPGDTKKINILTIVDVPLLVVLFLPRLFGLFWIGLATWAYSNMKKKRTAKEEAKEEAPAAAD
jgi:hypothetical protein